MNGKPSGRDLRFVEPEDAPTNILSWGRVKWICTPELCNSQHLSSCIVSVEPEKGHESHNHPGVEEILYFISGEGEQVVDGVRRKVKAGSLIHIPPDVYHETINTGWDQLKFLAVYSPAVIV